MRLSTASALALVLALPACRSNREQSSTGSLQTVSSVTSEPASSLPTTAAPTTAALTTAAPPLMPPLTCAELDPERAEPDRRRGKKSARWVSAAKAQLPTGWIAYHANGQLYLVSTDGTRRTVVGPGTQPRWSPYGYELMFVSAPEGQPPRLFATTPDCASVRAVSGPLIDVDAERQNYDDVFIRYALSPDGKHVAYLREFATSAPELFVIEIATGLERRLATQSDFSEPVWLPDARSIVFGTSADVGSTIVSIDLATGQARQLGPANHPRFSFIRDGRLLFQRARGDSHTIEDREAFLMLTDPVGTGATALSGSQLTPGLYREVQPAPDGITLAAVWSLWTGNGSAGPADEGLALFVVPPPQPVNTGGSPFGASPHAEITTFVRPTTRNLELGAGEALDLEDPTWAPDSRHLAFTLSACDVRLDSCAQQIVAVDTQLPRTQVVFLARGNSPQWQPRRLLPR